MNGAFRLQPAAGRLDRAIQRPRLVKLLQGRFDHRLTTVVGPGGSGKSTALALAVESNRVDPVGLDIWLGLNPTDNEPQQLLNGIGSAVQVEMDPGSESTIEAIAEAVWRHAPTEIALILDDAHLVGDGQSMDLLSDLVAALPVNGHLVLVGRTAPPMPTSRLQAHGDLLIVEAGTLEFDDSEIAALISRRSDNGMDGAELPRHAALADLRLLAGSGAQVDFLEEEILGSLDPARAKALARMSVLDEFDEDVTRALTDSTFTARALVADLPLIEQTISGSYRFHSLLRSVLCEQVSEEQRVATTLLAAKFEESRGNLPYSIQLLAEAGDSDGAVELARYIIAMPSQRRSYSELLTIRRILTTHRPELAVTALFECEYQAAQLECAIDPNEMVHRIESIAERARSEHDEPVEAVALFRAMTARDSDAMPILQEQVDRLAELATTSSVARLLMRHVGCAAAMLEGDIEEALRWLEEGEEPDPVVEMVYRSARLVDLGRPEDVGSGLGPDSLEQMPAGSEVTVAFSMWLRGEVSPEVGLLIVAELIVQYLPRRLLESSVSVLGVGAFVALSAGSYELAERYLNQGEGIANPNGTVRTKQFVLLGRAALLSIQGDDAPAVEILEQMFDELPLGVWPSRHHLMCLAFLYVGCPQTRLVLDGCDLGRSLAVSVRAGRAVIAMREMGSLAQAVALPWDEPDLLRVQVLPHHLCELALGAVLAGEKQAEVVLGQLPGIQHLLARTEADATIVVATEAAARLRRFPPKPSSDIQIVALGELQLWRDGELVEDNDWMKRRRVREILAYLVEHGSTQRSVIAAALWPELDEQKAAGNLRVNLNYLQRVLEPNRPKGAAPFHVQIKGERLFLHPDTPVDSRLFEQQILEALGHDRSGAPGPALDLYLHCLEPYRGTYLSDFDEAWSEDTRIRVDSFALGGFCRVGELIAARGEPEESLLWAQRALRISGLSERAGRLGANCLLAMQDRPSALQALK